jgi:hypothetical protein
MSLPLILAGVAVLVASTLPWIYDRISGMLVSGESAYAGKPTDLPPAGTTEYVEAIMASLPTEAPEVILESLRRGDTIYEAVLIAYGGDRD